MTYQPLLFRAARPLTPSQQETLRRYGSLEVVGVRAMRLARERRAHERRKSASTAFLAASTGILKRLPSQTKRNAQVET